jgi:hypothetical protein
MRTQPIGIIFFVLSSAVLAYPDIVTSAPPKGCARPYTNMRVAAAGAGP